MKGPLAFSGSKTPAHRLAHAVQAARQPCELQHPLASTSQLGHRPAAPLRRTAAGLSAVGGVLHSLRHRHSRRGRWSGSGRKTALRASKTMERQEMDRQRELEVKESLAASSPVPESFEQAISWAVSSSISAAEMGKMRQSMYFDAGGGDAEVGGDLGNVLPFAESFMKTIVQAEALEGGTACALFTDMGAAAMCTRRWEPKPENLEVDYFPQVLRGTEQVGMQERMKFEQLLQHDFIGIVAPTQAELPALLKLFEIMEEVGKDTPVVMFNANLIQNTYVAAGNLIKQSKELERTILPIFHLEQCDPEDDEDIMNPAVIARIWPRPFSLWEDNPEDPEAVDGFFLLDLNDEQAQDKTTVKSMLKASSNVALKWLEKQKRGLE